MRKFIVKTAPSGKGKPAPRSIRNMALWAQNHDDAKDKGRRRLPEGRRIVEVMSARVAGEETR